MPFSYASVIDSASPHDWSTERLKLVIDAARIGTFDYDLATDTLVWSQQCKALFGLMPDAETSYDVFLNALHPEDRAATEAAVHKSLDPHGDGAYSAEYRVVLPDGSIRWIGAQGRSYFEERDGRKAAIRMLGTVLDITERKHSEKVIREQAERQQAALLASNTGTFRWNAQTGEVDWDRSLDRLFGLPEGSSISSLDQVLALVHPDDHDEVVSRSRACAEVGADFEMEFRIVQPQGATRWLLGQGKMRQDAYGRPSYMMGACVDITGRKETESALRMSEANFRSLADSIPQPVWLTDETGWIFWYNHRWYELTGTTLEEMQGWGWRKVHHPDHVERVVERIRRSFETGQPWEDTFPLRRRDGTYGWFLSRALPVRDETGKIVRWVGTNTDITEQREIEAALMESEAKFRAIADSMPQMVWSTRPDGYHDYYNQRWYDFTGTPAGSTDGEGWNGMFHPEDQERAWKTWRHSLRTGDNYEIEYRLRRHDGAYRWVLGRALPMRDEATGEIVRWFGTCTDIEETKRAEQELKEALEAKEALLYEVNHRVKNSLAVVVSLLTLQAGRTRDDSLKESLLEARGRISVVAQVHQRLYTSSRHDSVELAHFLTDIANDVETLLDTESRVHLELDIEGDDRTLSIDKAVPLALVVSELLTNAVKYAFPRGMSGTIRLSVETSERGVCIVVEDDGVGLPAGFQIASSTGFGMRIVTALSRQIRAQLSVPPSARGTRFEIFLPDQDSEED